jgi:hypothetical protein
MKESFISRRILGSAMRLRLSSLVLPVVLVVGLSASEQRPFIKLTEKKSTLSRALDSLQIEKQIRKREGKSIGGLDARTAALRDSIEAVRRRLASLDAIRDDAGLEDDGSILSSIPLWHPRTTFDWIIVGVAVTAVGSGILLLFGLLASLRQAGRRRRKSGVRPSAKQVRMEPRRKIPVSSREEKDADTSVDEPEEIDSIRYRIARDTGHFAAVPNQSHPGPSGGATPKTTRARIVACLRKGLTVQQTARELQVSIDQVNLVSRIADSDPT